ncbi:MAG: TerB family tellurite resistance protein [Gammaproteobacteria bacterium]
MSAGAADAAPLAAAALLIEIARADHRCDEAERQAIVAAVGHLHALTAEDAQALVATATEAVDDAISLDGFTGVVNRQLSRAQKIRLLEALWRVAYADGRVDHYEEYYIRKIADLLHLGHSDFIRAKLVAEPAS